MPRIKRFLIKGLFGAPERTIDFNSNSPITIISGPNGVGKTHMLTIIRSMLALDLKALSDEPFDRAELTFSRPNRVFSVTIDPGNDEEDEEEKIILSVLSLHNRQVLGEVAVPYSSYQGDEVELPDWLIRQPDGSYYDIRRESRLPTSFVHRRYGQQARNLKRELLENFSWLRSSLPPESPILIDTQRIGAASSGPDGGRPTLKVAQYIEQVKTEISYAQRNSLRASQRADRTFAARVLEKARTPTIKEKDLKERYQSIADRHQEFYASGLTREPVDVEFPDSRTNPTERRILNVFLNDWEQRLKPLIPVNEKLKALRSIINDKLSDKSLDIDETGTLFFRRKDGFRLSVGMLSSGEQHLLALFTLLLFSAPQNSVVLIDEPEISMHAAWKHSFLDDINAVAGIAGIQVIAATHSSAIINGNWDLVQEIGV